MSTKRQWAWFDAGVMQERSRIIALLQTDEAFDAVYNVEMGADGALADIIHLITRKETA